ncbi:MAG: arginine--tRNA ligase [Deltaproteobacteria bacterium]|nr:MAG: arginine--tRNA ligase [Deltaproteobacteria bacterium]
MKSKIEELLRLSLKELISKHLISSAIPNEIQVDRPTQKEFGDFATNVAMPLASREGKPPRDIASIIVHNIKQRHGNMFSSIEIAGPGFINFKVKPEYWVGVLGDILRDKDAYGKSSYGKGKKVQIEFVSANPTGPLHVGHGRGAAVGDTLANILKITGFLVEREYYINDVGNQMNTLGRSVFARYLELCGEEGDFPEDGYQGDYIRDIAADIKARYQDELLHYSTREAVALCRDFASKRILKGIREDLDSFGIEFDRWFSESTLHEEGKIQKAVDILKSRDLIYTSDGALWFRSTRFGDEKDRVVRKRDGTLTYFASDIAYHMDKLERGYDKIIDIWGADHHGYVPRMRAAIEALGGDGDSFHALLIQLVSLERSGRPVYMSTRKGEFVTLKEIIDEVGKDAARYFFLMRKCDSHLVFDLELAKKKSNENPVFYIQYAHARICSILNKASKMGLVPDIGAADLGYVSRGDDLALIKALADYPSLLISCARNLEPHHLSFYLLELAGLFHSFYNKNKVISDNRELSLARLCLVDAVRQVLRGGLSIMGIDAPEVM